MASKLLYKLMIFTVAVFVESATSAQGANDVRCDVSECSLFNVEVLSRYIDERINASIRELVTPQVDDTTAFNERIIRATERVTDEKVDSRFFDLVDNQPGKMLLSNACRSLLNYYTNVAL